MISALIKLSITPEGVEKQLNKVNLTSHEPSSASQNHGTSQNQNHKDVSSTAFRKAQFEGGYLQNYKTNQNIGLGPARGGTGGQIQSNWQPWFMGGNNCQGF